MKPQFCSMKKIWNYLIVFFIFCGITLPINYATAQSSNVENIAVLFIVDDSGSMGMYDPNNLRYTATKMMISALDEGDKVGFIRFSSGSKIVTEKMIELDSKQSKTELLNMIQPVTPDGYTDFKAAFEDASLLLSKESLDAYKTVIVFLTDGRPEIPNFYYNYPNEAVSAAVALDIPVYAIGLTSYGQTAVLQRIAEETKGKLIPANSAKDLVDSFLQILGELKDRTIASGTTALTEKSVEFFLDPALTPYISRISFVASRTPGMRLSLFDPTGTLVQEGTSSVSFMMTDDPSFTVFTIESPVSGIWRFSYEGSEKIEARAILRSRLRTQITSPIGAIQAGKPALIVANIVEELADGSTRKVIGSAEFNAEITLPDGNKMSLDRFYDDGTHGDILAGDGNYSREFVETEQSGTYTVQLNGTKDLIPVFAFRTFATAFVPSLKLLEPTQESLDIRSEPIQIRIGFDTDQDVSEKIEGKLQLEVCEPDGKTLHENLELKGNEFFGIFLPNQDGLHTLNINSTELFVQGIRVDQTLTKTLNIKRIPTLTVVESYFGYDIPLTLNRFDLQDIKQGIPFTINVRTTSLQEETINVSTLQLPGFEVEGSQAISVKPNELNELAVKIKPTVDLAAGDWSGYLLLSPVSKIDIPESKIPVSFELYQKTIRLSLESVKVRCDKLLCFLIKPIQMRVTSDSNSTKEEVIEFTLNGIPELNLVNAKQYIQPGTNELLLELKPKGLLKTGSYAGTITFDSTNPDLTLENQQHGDDLRFDFQIPGFWQRCKFHVIGLIALLFVLFIILKAAARGVVEATKKPIVRGTLVLWKQEDPDTQLIINLNEKLKADLSVGSGSDCDIILNDPSVASKHFRLTVTKQDGKQTIMLYPLSDMNSGYRRISGSTPLDESQVYSCGVYSFKFISDSNI